MIIVSITLKSVECIKHEVHLNRFIWRGSFINPRHFKFLNKRKLTAIIKSFFMRNKQRKHNVLDPSVSLYGEPPTLSHCDPKHVKECYQKNSESELRTDSGSSESSFSSPYDRAGAKFESAVVVASENKGEWQKQWIRRKYDLRLQLFFFYKISSYTY